MKTKNLLIGASIVGVGAYLFYNNDETEKGGSGGGSTVLNFGSETQTFQTPSGEKKVFTTITPQTDDAIIRSRAFNQLIRGELTKPANDRQDVFFLRNTKKEIIGGADFENRRSVTREEAQRIFDNRENPNVLNLNSGSSSSKKNRNINEMLNTRKSSNEAEVVKATRDLQEENLNNLGFTKKNFKIGNATFSTGGDI